MHARGFAGLLSRMQEQRKHEPTTEQLPRIDRAGARRLIASAGPDVGRDGGHQWGGAARSWFIKTSSWHAIVLYGAVLAGVMTTSLEGPQHAWSSGGLLRSPPDSGAGGKEFTMMKNLSAVGVAAVVSVASSLCAAPPGYVIVADSQAQFSGTQGQSGWWYLYDQGSNTAVTEIPYFVTLENQFVWCASTVAGDGGGYCIVSATSMHPNTAFNCNTTSPGDQRPLREWRSTVPMHALVQMTGAPNVLSPGLRIDLMANHSVVESWTSIKGSTPSIDVTIDVGIVQSIGVLVDALGSCHNDGFDHQLRIYAPDCNANEIADYLDITADSSLDRNYDGVLDSCQCAEHPEVCCNADLTANGVIDGADLGALLAFWGPRNPVFPRADINADGNVDGADLGVLLASWGPCSP